MRDIFIISIIMSKKVNIVIISPKSNEVITLSSSLPIVSTPIILKAQIFIDGIEMITMPINWQLKLVWYGSYRTYKSFFNFTGNSVSTNVQTGGKLYIRAATTIDGKEYSATIKILILGSNPSIKQLINYFPNDILKSIAWLESSWRQFDSKGRPLKNPNSSMIGLMQISERWWGTPQSSIKSNNFSRIAWDWSYNIQAAKEILDYYYKLVSIRYPNESNESKWDRTIKAYNAGSSTIKTRNSADNFLYVKKIRSIIKEKPWKK